MIPDPIQPGVGEASGVLGSAATSRPQGETAYYAQPISCASIQAAERTFALLKSVAKILTERLTPNLCLVASEHNSGTNELYRLVVGLENKGVKLILQRLQDVQIVREKAQISTFDQRQAMLRNLRDIHLFALAEANERDDLREKFVQASSVDIDGVSFRAQISAITDPISPWSESTVVLSEVDSERAKLAIGRSDPHKTVSPQIVELEFSEDQVRPLQISFGGSTSATQSAIYRPQLEMLCERELPRMCDWVERILGCEEPWVDVPMGISNFL